MPKYVDGFVIPLPKKSIAAYTKMAKLGCKVWMEHGALEYRECIGEDLKPKGVTPIAKLFGAKPNETIVFAWITYKSRTHRDAVNAKVMKDPRMQKVMASGAMPFDTKRMAYAGFSTIVGR
jgi:uncharacterized protein YbaA (DUF1428 family)